MRLLRPGLAGDIEVARARQARAPSRPAAQRLDQDRHLLQRLGEERGGEIVHQRAIRGLALALQQPGGGADGKGVEILEGGADLDPDDDRVDARHDRTAPRRPTARLDGSRSTPVTTTLVSRPAASSPAMQGPPTAITGITMPVRRSTSRRHEARQDVDRCRRAAPVPW